MSDPRAGRRNFRGKPRPGRRLEVEYGPESESARELSFTKNLGVGGTFILSTTPLPPGTRIGIRFRLPTTPEALDLLGEVRWVLDAKSGAPAAVLGMGIKFDPLDVDQLLTLNEYFASVAETADLDQV